MIKRNTLQRALVLETVQRLQSHPTADEIYAEITKVHPSISRATVYRNLQQLCEQGSIQRRVIPGSPDRYDHMVGEHYHVRCTQCGKVIDLGIKPIKDLDKEIYDNQGFMITGHTIVFDGICPECQKNNI